MGAQHAPISYAIMQQDPVCSLPQGRPVLTKGCSACSHLTPNVRLRMSYPHVGALWQSHKLKDFINKSKKA